MQPFRNESFSHACDTQVAYGFYGRKGGVSEGIYSGLNCGTGSSDDQEKVAQNRSKIAADLGAPDYKISSLWQCHSATCVTIKSHVEEGDARPKADALVTDVAGLAIGVLTADCCPVLFIGRKSDDTPVIGAAHAGWGGALNGVIEATIDQMLVLGTVLESITACTGPCIRQPSYEVTAEYAQPFVGKHADAQSFFLPAVKPGHLMFDMPGYVSFRLRQSRVENVHSLDLDTYADEENFYSFRRATHRGEPDYGRELSAIMIRP